MQTGDQVLGAMKVTNHTSGTDLSFRRAHKYDHGPLNGAQHSSDPDPESRTRKLHTQHGGMSQTQESMKSLETLCTGPPTMRSIPTGHSRFPLSLLLVKSEKCEHDNSRRTRHLDQKSVYTVIWHTNFMSATIGQPRLVNPPRNRFTKG